MHERAFITFNKDEAETEYEARRHAFNFLLDNGFSDCKFFSRGISDGFCVGGRYSGALVLADTAGLSEFHEWYNKQKTSRDIHIKIEKDLFYIAHFYKRFPNSDILPTLFLKRVLSDYGTEHDAMIVTRKIYDMFLKNHEGKEESDGEFWDLNFDNAEEDFIGTKWIVVIDYHI